MIFSNISIYINKNKITIFYLLYLYLSEEWVSKKKTEVTNTKQIETRVKRQVVLENGKVVEDSGPLVTTNTTEDTETQEHHQTEVRVSVLIVVFFCLTFLDYMFSYYFRFCTVLKY